jgi:peptide methionine sulfoxide reductase msrA/msrB
MAETEETTSSRISSEEKTALSTYIGVALIAVLGASALYFFFFSRAKNSEVTGYDPNRPVPTDAVLKVRLKANVYHVVRENGTETAFQNAYWDKFEPGIYVDVIAGDPLFTSLDKYDAGNGRPTFSKPISPDLLVERPDNSFDMQRVEVRAKHSDAHLGHVFADPKSPSGRRYAINSCALRFIPREDMSTAGYANYRQLLDGVQAPSPAPNR